MLGALNPNYRNASLRTCVRCGSAFHRYGARGKFCSHQCFSTGRRKLPELKAAKKPRVGRIPVVTICAVCAVVLVSSRHAKTCGSRACRYPSQPFKAIKIGRPRVPREDIHCRKCGAQFYASRSKHRVYCSYRCFVADGGPVHAGLRAAETIKRCYRWRRDANHDAIERVLRRRCPLVVDASFAGCGVPDFVVWTGFDTLWVEAKNRKTTYGRKGLNSNQRAWAARGGVTVHLVYSPDEVEALLDAHYEKYIGPPAPLPVIRVSSVEEALAAVGE